MLSLGIPWSQVQSRPQPNCLRLHHHIGSSLCGTLQQVPIENPPADHMCPDLFSTDGYAAPVRLEDMGTLDLLVHPYPGFNITYIKPFAADKARLENLCA